MAYDHTQPIDAATTRAKIESAIASMRVQMDAVERIVAALKPFDGKTVNKRLATAVAAACPDLSVHYDTSDNAVFGWKKLYIWCGAIPYNERIVLELCGSACGIYSHERLTRGPSPDGTPYEKRESPGSAWHLLNHGVDIAAFESILANLPALVDAFNAARLALKSAVSAFAPANWAVFSNR